VSHHLLLLVEKEHTGKTREKGKGGEKERAGIDARRNKSTAQLKEARFWRVFILKAVNRGGQKRKKENNKRGDKSENFV